MPAAVSTCAAKTTSGRLRPMASTTSSTGGGTQGACRSADTGRALQTVVWAATDPASKICDQR